jgi:endonuclease/exonuclease/phosphatase (EEP) superfamily protein YafD
MTYNVNWGGACADLAVAIIRAEQPDIVCLQETNAEWEKYLRGALAREYRYISFRESAGRAGGGLGFLSKVPAAEVAYVPSDTGWFDGWIMGFQTGVGKVQVLNVHLRPPVSDRGSWVSGYLTTGDDREREIKQFYARQRRMDHIVYGSGLHCYQARVVKGGASDHYPVVGVFGLGRETARDQRDDTPRSPTLRGS